ncbi:hypothetical protein RhiTH_006918 [Rhizoctonia solani]
MHNVQDQLSNIVPQHSVPPPPPPSPTSTSSNAPEPTPSSTLELKFAKPKKFSSKKEDSLNFIIACQAYIMMKGASCSNKEKIMWIPSYFEGAAEHWVCPYKGKKVFRGEAVPMLDDVDNFWTKFTKHYMDTNYNKKDCQKLNNLQQKLSLQEDTCQLQQYSVSLGHSGETLHDRYYCGLKKEVKDIMLSTMFQWFCATVQQTYDRAEEIENHIECSQPSYPSCHNPYLEGLLPYISTVKDIYGIYDAQ